MPNSAAIVQQDAGAIQEDKAVEAKTSVQALFQKTTPEQRDLKSMDCSKVLVKPDVYGGDGAFAAVDIKNGELVEYGLMRRLPLDGHQSTYVFTWSDDRTVWATAGGCAMFYNTHPTTPNTEMIRYFDEDRFEIFALEDIKAGDELLHTYRSLRWRQCFVESLPQQ